MEDSDAARDPDRDIDEAIVLLEAWSGDGGMTEGGRDILRGETLKFLQAIQWRKISIQDTGAQT